MGITTQRHINIVSELRDRAIKDKSQLDSALLQDEKERFAVAIAGLETTRKRMMIDLLQQEKQNVTQELDKLNG